MIAITRTDGGVSLASNEAAAAVWIKAHPELYVSHAEVAEHPTDRTFRNAWKSDLTVDMPKAVEITKDRLRAERAPLLEAQDVAFQRAMEDGADTAAIVAEKKRLRDITKLADKPGITLDELKSLKV